MCCIILYFSPTTATITKISVFVDCIANVTEIGFKRHNPSGQYIDLVGSLDQCIELCANTEDCVAIDIIIGFCFELDKGYYSVANLVDDTEHSVHYTVGKC